MRGIILAFLEIIYYFCHVNECCIDIYTKSKDLPTLLEGNYFHSRELFIIYEQTPGCTPYMVVVSNKEGQTLAQLLVAVNRKGNWFPPYIYTHAHAHEEGIYANEANKEELFCKMLQAITLRLDRRLCLYIEFSGIRKKMFGYRAFRQQGYFPVVWQEVHTSLHSKAPEERLSEKIQQRIKKLKDKGIITQTATNREDIHSFHQLLKRYYRFKPRRHIPNEQYFQEMAKSHNAKIFLTTYGGKNIGGCACVYSEGNAYLCYLAAKRKTYSMLHPDTMVVWNAIQYAYEHDYNHIYFMDVGLPWHRNPFREFILSFGGKPVSKYRWFRFYSHTINKILSWLYKDK